MQSHAKVFTAKIALWLAAGPHIASHSTPLHHAVASMLSAQARDALTESAGAPTDHFTVYREHARSEPIIAHYSQQHSADTGSLASKKSAGVSQAFEKVAGDDNKSKS